MQLYRQSTIIAFFTALTILLWSVLYKRFHCISYLPLPVMSGNILRESLLGPIVSKHAVFWQKTLNRHYFGINVSYHNTIHIVIILKLMIMIAIVGLSSALQFPCKV